MQYITLNNDVKMPAEGMGTFLMSPADAEVATLNALRAGFRHIDTANGYYNEAGVARGIRRSGIPRAKRQRPKMGARFLRPRSCKSSATTRRALTASSRPPTRAWRRTCSTSRES